MSRDLIDSILETAANLSRLGAVSCCEARCYEWLRGVYWADFLVRHRVDRRRLVVSRLGEEQMLVNWRGDPNSSRQLLFVTHVDREGYIVTALDRHDEGVVLKAVQPFHRLAEMDRIGGDVSIRVGTRDTTEVARGKLVAVGDPILATDSADALPGLPVEIEIREIEPSGIAVIEQALQAGGWSAGRYVTAHHVFNRLDYAPVRCRGNIVEADCVDNTVGVSIATEVLAKVVKEGAPSNVGVLYTSGEELGLIGAFDAARGLATWTREQLESTMVIVIDCSDVTKSVRMQTIHESLAYAGEPGAPCRTDTVAVRLGDAWTRFDVGVAHVLQQCCLGVRHISQSSSTERPRNAICDAIDTRWLGSAGFFQGGLCDATVLQRALLIWAEGVQASLPHVGSLAIPITNYRMVRRGTVEPEVTTLSAIASAAAVAYELVFIHQLATIPSAGKAVDPNYKGYNSLRERNRKCKSAEAMVADWREFFWEREKVGLLGLRRWWMEPSRTESD